jgi:pyrimidine deaminase RibD-like protein
MAEIYIATSREDRIATAIAALEPCSFHGRITPDQIKIVLGEVGNIWPESIRCDAIAQYDSERQLD